MLLTGFGARVAWRAHVGPSSFQPFELSRAAGQPLRERLQRARAWLASSPFATGALRVVAVASCILFLAAIGRMSGPARASPLIPVAASSGSNASPVPLPSPALAPSVMSEAPVAAPIAGRTSGRATPEDPVYVNEATAEELRRLPGVGVKRADAILALRVRVGRFQRIEDLLRVKGVGRRTLGKWRPLVRLDRRDPDAGAAR
jgi:competence protein ComEA